MEQGMEVLYETLAVFVFVAALSLVFWIFHSLSSIEVKAKQNLYEQHVLYTSTFETQ